jgi:cell wall-associated NlpC family hydrolase
MLSSDSPSDFVSQASIMNVVSSRRAAVLTAATKASTAATKAASDAKAAQAAAAKLTHDLAAKRTLLSKQAAQSKAMLDRLSGSERQSFLASQGGSGDRASRDESRADTGTPPAVDVPASGGAAAAVAAARSKLGSSYVWAASGPSTFDCSGLTMYAWAQAGVSLPHSSSMQFSSGNKVSASSLQPGDLVFYGSPIHHVALYVGGGQVIHAPQTGDVVRYASVDMMPIVGAVRP